MKTQEFDLARLMGDIVFSLKSAFDEPKTVSNPLYLVVDIRNCSAFLSSRGKVEGLDNYPAVDLIYRDRRDAWCIYNKAVYEVVQKYIQLKPEFTARA